MNKKLGYQILELCGILLGNAILAFGFAAFVLPHGMITGGATGLGLVTSRVFGVDLSVSVAVYNIILFAVGAFVLGKKICTDDHREYYCVSNVPFFFYTTAVDRNDDK